MLWYKWKKPKSLFDQDENNGNNTSRTASVTPTNNEPVTPTAITDEDKHNGNNVNKSGESETNNALTNCPIAHCKTQITAWRMADINAFINSAQVKPSRSC